MKNVTAADVRAFLYDRYAERLSDAGINLDRMPEDFDLLTGGIIDSFGILEMIGAMEEHFGSELDFEAIDPDHLTMIGPLSRFVESQLAARTSREG